MSAFFSTGAAALVILVSAVLTVPTSLVLVSLYQRSVRKAMLRRGTGSRTETASASTPRSFLVPAAALALHEIGPAAEPTLDRASVRTLEHARRGPWRALVVYAIAGLGFALLTALILLIADGSAVLPLRLTVVTVVFAWPIVLTANLITDASRSVQVRNMAIYAGLFLVLAMGLGGLNPRDAATLLLLEAGPPTLLLLAFMHPRVRTIGPLVFTFMTIGVFGANLLLLPLENTSIQRAAATVSVRTGLDVTTWIILATLIGFAIAGVAGWWTLSLVRGRYDAKLISDQSLSIDAIWLVFTVDNAVNVASQSPVWGFVTLGTFVVYRYLVTVGFRRFRERYRWPTNHRLLLLRVFGSAARSAQLMAQVGAQWRYVGSIQLITGTDLATSTLEPHDFLEFVRGRLGNRHIRDQESLERHLAEMDLMPDFDARFRINQFLCYEDTWRPTLERLVRSTDVVLTDVRGFSQANKGVVFELGAVINLVPLERVVLIIDRTTDLAFLRGVLEQAWAQMAPTSPNLHAPTAALAMCRLQGAHDSNGIRTLLGQLAQAASARAAPASGVSPIVTRQPPARPAPAG